MFYISGSDFRFNSFLLLISQRKKRQRPYYQSDALNRFRSGQRFLQKVGRAYIKRINHQPASHISHHLSIITHHKIGNHLTFVRIFIEISLEQSVLSRIILVILISFLSLFISAQNAYVELSKYNLPGSTVTKSASFGDMNACLENGKIYTIGYASASNFTSTEGSVYQVGKKNLFLAVHDTLGTLLYSSVFVVENSGSAYDAYITVNNGNVFIAGNVGWSSTGGLAVTNSSSFPGGSSGYVVYFSSATISSNSTGYDYASYIGGSDWDAVTSIASDNNYFYVVGNTWSSDVNTTNGSYLFGDGDILFYRISLNAFNNNLDIHNDPTSYVSYFGGFGDDYVEIGCMKVNNGNAYFAFNTYSDDLPVTNSSTYSSTSLNYIGAMMKISSTGMDNNASSILAIDYCTYIEVNDNAWLDQVEYGGDIFMITGFDQGSYIPTTLGPNSAPNGTYVACAVSESTMASNGPIDYYRIVDGYADSWIADITYHNSYFYISGTTIDPAFPTTDGSVLQSSNGDVFVMQIATSSIQNNISSTADFQILLGGGSSDQSDLIKADANGVHVLCESRSGDVITSNGTQATTNYPPYSGSQETKLYFNLCEDGSVNYSTFIEKSRNELISLLPDNNSVYTTGFVGASAFPNLGYMVTVLPTAPINFSVFTKITFLDPQIIDPDTLYPSNQTVCEYGTADLIEGPLFNSQNNSLPDLYTDGIPFSQNLSNYVYQWQQSNLAAGPWTDIPGAFLSDYLPVVGVNDQYYRRLTQFVECGDTMLLSTSDVAAVIIDVNTAPIADAGGVFHTCPGVTLPIGGAPSATGGTAPYTYAWDNGLSAVANPNVTPSVSGIYTLTVTDNLGCKHSDQAQVYVHEANAGADVSSCAGQPANIGSSGTGGLAGTTYSWSPTSSIACATCPATQVTPAADQIYTLTQTIAITGGGTCQTTDDVLVSVVAGPANPNFAGPDQTICFGDITSLGTTAQAGFTYNWYPGTYLNSAIVSNPTYDAGNLNMPDPDPYHYYVVATSQGCDFVDEVDVYTIKAEAGIDGCGPRIIGTSDETPNINETYQWTLLSGPGGFTGPTNTPTTTVSASVGGVSVYQLEVSFNGVTCTDIVEVADCGCAQFAIIPHSSVGCPSYLLTNDSIQLTAGTAGNQSNLTYSWSPTVGLSSYNTQTVTLQTNAASTYSVIVTDPLDPGFYCEQFIDVNVPTWSIPSFNHVDTALCLGDSLPVGNTGIGIYTYDWTYLGLPYSSQANPMASPDYPGTHVYNVAIEDTAGCVYYGSSTIQIEEVVVDAGADWIVCENAIIQIGEPGNTDQSYSWSPPNSPWQNGTDENSAQPEVIITTDVQFILTATSNLSGCSNSDTVVVIVDNLPVIPPMNDTTICLNDNALIGVSGFNGASSYSWSPTNDLSCSNCAQPLVTAQTTTLYTLTVDFMGDCQTIPTEDILVTVNDPSFDLPDISYCPSDGPVNIGAGAPIANTYYWSPAALVSNSNIADPQTNVSSTTNFTLFIRDASGCEFVDTVVVESTIPTPYAGGNVSACLSDGVVVLGDPSNTGNLTWTPSIGLSSTTQGQVLFTPVAGGTYDFAVSNTNGTCTVQDSVTVTISDFSLGVQPSQVVCENGCIEIGLPSQAGVAYSWFPSANLSLTNSSNPTACPSSDIIYTLVATNAQGCVTEETVQVIISDSLAATIALSDLTLCLADSGAVMPASITPSAGNIINWSPVVGLSNTTMTNPFVSPTGLGFTNYSVSVIDPQSGCESASSMTVSVIDCSVTIDSCDIPFTIAILNDSLCSGDELIMSFSSDSANVSYQWTSSSVTVTGHASGAGANLNQSLNNNSGSIGTVIYTITPDINGCVGEAQSAVVYVDTELNINVLGDTIYCENDSTELASNVEATNVLWSNGSTDSTSYFTQLDNPVILTVASEFGCTFSDTLLLTEQLIAHHYDTLGICSGDSILIFGQFESLAGDYIDTLVNNGCDSVVHTNLMVNPVPNMNISNVDTICAGTDTFIELTSDSVGVTFSWSSSPGISISGSSSGTGDTIQQTLVNSSMSMDSVVYTITPSMNGCDAPAQDVTIMISGDLTLSILGSQYHCEFDSTSLSSSLSGTYQWSNGLTDSLGYFDATDSPVDLVVIDEWGCEHFDTLNVIEQPVVMYYDTLTICQGDSILIFSNYEQIAGDYMDTLLHNGCDSIVDVHLVVNSLPTFNLSSDLDTLCAGASVHLEVDDPLLSYTWNIGGVGTMIDTAFQQSIMVTVQGTDVNLCSTWDSTLVTVLPNQSALFEYTDTLFCNSSANILPMIIGDPNGYFSGTTGLIIDSLTGEVDVTSSSLGSHTITYTNQGLCVSTFDTTLTVVAQLDPYFSLSHYELCADAVAPTVTPASGGGTFISSPIGLLIDSQSGLIDVNNSTPGTYTISHELNVTGCPATIYDTLVTINALPTLLYDSIYYICDSSGLVDVNLELTGDGPWELSYLDPSGNNFTISIASSPFLWTDLEIGDYELLTINDQSCSQSLNGMIRVIQQSITGLGTLNDYVVCNGTLLEVDAFDNTNSFDSIVWSTVTLDVGQGMNGVGDIADFSAQNTTGQTIVSTVGVAGYLNGCLSDSSYFTIEVFPTTTPSIVVSDTLGCVPMVSMLESDLSDCVWNVGGEEIVGCTISTVLNTPGCVDVTLEGLDANGCMSVLTISDLICAESTPVANFTVTPDDLDLLDTEVFLENESLNEDAVTWYIDSIWFSQEWNVNYTLPSSDTATYEICLVATNDIGCEDIYCENVTVGNTFSVYVPNTFTPGTDGRNDIFIPVIQGDHNFYEFLVFNRWGQLIFETDNVNNGWDGTYLSEPCQQDAYVWKVSVTDNANSKRYQLIGHVTLVR